MRKFFSFPLFSACAFILVSCGKPAPEAADGRTVPSGEPAAEQPMMSEPVPAPEAVSDGEAAFAVCRSCHAIQKDAPKGVGPNLWGVVDRPVASVAGYSYSDAMKAKGGVWGVATLDEYLAAPMKVVKGTKMAFPGVMDAARRKALIDWLATQKD